MAKWRVWNMHPNGLTHRELFRGDMVEIKAGSYVLMDYEDAYQFKGQFCPIKLDGMGQPDPVSFKVLKLEPHTENAKALDGMGQPDPVSFKVLKLEPHTENAKAEVTQKFVCQKDGKVFSTKAELDAYTEANYKDDVFHDEALDEIIEATAPKKQRGRPPKEKTL